MTEVPNVHVQIQMSHTSMWVPMRVVASLDNTTVKLQTLDLQFSITLPKENLPWAEIGDDMIVDLIMTRAKAELAPQPANPIPSGLIGFDKPN